MSTYLTPIVFGLFVWWFSTGLALWVVGLSGRAPRAVLGGTAATFALALAALALTRSDTGTTGTYLAFTAAILVWGAQEVAFLTGCITGPWRAPCPAGVTGWARMGYAIRAILYHEIALALSGLAILALTWGGPNRVGIATFGVLLAMRVSAKFNVFLGVPNITESFMPAAVDHLKSFFARRPMNGLFPVSITASTVALVLLVGQAWTADASSAAAITLIATLVGLGLVEHWFLVLPLPVEALWSWSGVKQGAEPDAATLDVGVTSSVSTAATVPLGPPATVIKLEPRPALKGSRPVAPRRSLQLVPIGNVQGPPAGPELIGRKTT